MTRGGRERKREQQHNSETVERQESGPHSGLWLERVFVITAGNWSGPRAQVKKFSRFFGHINFYLPKAVLWHFAANSRLFVRCKMPQSGFWY